VAATQSPPYGSLSWGLALVSCLLSYGTGGCAVGMKPEGGDRTRLVYLAGSTPIHNEATEAQAAQFVLEW
jgi:hypothetical protein